MAQRLCLAPLALIVACAVGLLANPCVAQRPGPKAIAGEKFRAEAGSIDGAIWAFKLTPRAKSPKNNDDIVGRFRISNLEIFQAETAGGELSKKIGASKQFGQRTEAEFESLKGLTATAREVREFKGKSLMKFVKPGVWEGTFIDGEGFVWTMNIKRIRE